MTYRPAKKFTATIAGISAIALVLTACSSSSTSSTSSTSAGSSAAATEASGGAAATTSAGAAIDAGGALPATSDWCEKAKAEYGDLTGKTVGVYTGIIAPEDVLYQKSYEPFTECTGAKVVYEGSKEFEAQVIVRVQSGNPPDIGIFPQPGLIKQIVETTGKMTPVSPFVEANVDEYFSEDWKAYGTVNDLYFATPNGAGFKSLVWYSPETFKAKGYTVPTTWEELIALSDQIAATGAKPWCLGISSGDATGWPLTDWLEEYVLREAGPDVYDQWINHEVKFSDPPVAAALARMGELIKDPKYVNGGFGDVATIASTTFQDAGQPVLPARNECTFYRMSSFYETNYPAGTTFGKDAQINAFYFPAFNDKFGTPVLGAGEFYAAFSDRPEVQAFQYYTTTPEFANTRAQLGFFLSANKGLQASSVTSPILQEALAILQKPDTVFRFDASDLMPAAVGSDAEWKQMTAWITGQDDATTLANIDAAWPVI